MLTGWCLSAWLLAFLFPLFLLISIWNLLTIFHAVIFVYTDSPYVSFALSYFVLFNLTARSHSHTYTAFSPFLSPVYCSVPAPIFWDCSIRYWGRGWARSTVSCCRAGREWWCALRRSWHWRLPWVVSDQPPSPSSVRREPTDRRDGSSRKKELTRSKNYAIYVYLTFRTGGSQGIFDSLCWNDAWINYSSNNF